MKRIAQLANDNTRSMGIGLSPCYLPQTGKPSFDLEENEMEIGLGHHGEPGIEKTTIRTAQETVQACTVSCAVLIVVFSIPGSP